MLRQIPDMMKPSPSFMFFESSSSSCPAFCPLLSVCPTISVFHLLTRLAAQTVTAKPQREGKAPKDHHKLNTQFVCV